MAPVPIVWEASLVAYNATKSLRVFRLDLTHRLVLLVQEVPTSLPGAVCWAWCLTQSVQGDNRSFHEDLVIRTLKEEDPNRAKEEALQDARFFIRQVLERLGG